MRPVSSAFLQTLRGSHSMTARARVAATFQTGTDPDGTDLPIAGGDVTLDATADVRGTVELETPGESMWPGNAADLLAPYGNELFIERGVRFGNGVTEWVSQGYFRIEAPEQETAPDGPIRLTCKDRMQAVIDARMLAPRQFAANWLRYDVLDNLVQEVYPAVTIEWNDVNGNDPIGRTLICEEDRFAFCRDLVLSAGMTWRWDHRGVLVVAPPPDPTNPVFEVNHGRDGVLVAMSRQLTREGVYNAVVASGEAGDTVPPARGVAVDSSPASPTYYHGRFGKVPRYYSSPFLTTNAQATSAAQALLMQSIGLPYNVNFGAVPNPALEPGDPIKVTYPESSRSLSGRTETHLIERLVMPLTADEPMTAGTREQTVVVIGVP